MRLRAELLSKELEDGAVELLDLILQRTTRLEREEWMAIQSGAVDPLLEGRLQAALLLEGPTADVIRQQAWRTLVRPWPERAASRSPAVDVGRASGLSALVSPAWRSPERWRRLIEEAAAGNRVHTLRGFIDGELLLQAGARWSYERFDNDVVRGARHVVESGPVHALFTDPALRALVGAVLDAQLGETVHINAWALDEGDAMAGHADGPRYAGTLSIGMSPGWRAGDGGAIAFGPVGPGGAIDVQTRWLPQLGDALVFRPDPLLVHQVEPVAGAPRHSVTGWWID